MKRKMISMVVCAYAVFTGGMIVGRRSANKGAEVEYQELKQRLAKFEDYFAITNKWMKNRNQGLKVADYFKNNNYYKIAIYGMGEIGKRLYEELKLEGMEIEYAFDRNAQRLDPTLNIYGLDKPVPPVDVIVVTPTFDYDKIVEQLKKITDCKIISISDVVSKS